jgi:acetylornithine/N-succinyldiaminopimelate aminotransferase
MLSDDPTASIIALGKKYLTENYRQQPIVPVRGDGCYVWDAAGRRYLDLVAGVAVSVLGHAHPRLVGAICSQAARLLHVSNLYYIEPQVRLAEALCTRSFAQKVFFCNSGAEANEAAIKLARRYQYVQGQPDRIELIATHGSFHGRTIATVALTGQPKYHEGFGPLLPGVKHVAYGDLVAMDAVVGERTCAVIVEPIQGEGGVQPAPPGYLRGLRELTRSRGALLIFDEVQTGTGRTGRFFAHEWDEVTPDICSLAKGLAGGVPIGAMLATEEVAKGFAPGMHASTFGGNPLACAAGLATVEAIDREGLLENAREAGAYLGRGLAEIQAQRKVVRAVRGRGLLWGVAVEVEPAKVVERCRESGLLVNVAGKDVVRLAPPLVISRGQVDDALAVLDGVLGTF